MKLLYLAGPFTHPDAAIRKIRQTLLTEATARLMQSSFAVFSPVTHSRNIVQHLPARLIADHEFWMEQCLPVLRRCDALVIAPLTGWKESRGLKEEVLAAVRARIPVLVYQDGSQLFDTFEDVAKTLTLLTTSLTVINPAPLEA